MLVSVYSRCLLKGQYTLLRWRRLCCQTHWKVTLYLKINTKKTQASENHSSLCGATQRSRGSHVAGGSNVKMPKTGLKNRNKKNNQGFNSKEEMKNNQSRRPKKREAKRKETKKLRENKSR